MMKKILIACLTLLFALPVFAKNTILIIGDSLSAAYGIDPAAGWVKLLEQRLQERKYDYQVVNASISGDTLSNGLQRLPKALEEHKPTLTIIELGANDGLRGIPVAMIRKNLQRMITLVKETNSRVMVLGVRLPSRYGEEYNNQFTQIFEDLAEEPDLIVVPLFLKNIDTDPQLMQADHLHPTAAAQSIILDNIWPKLILAISS